MKTKIKELSAKIIKARNDYYNGKPSMTDAAFDLLCEELTKLDPNNPAITAVGAPTVSEWPKVTHTVPMGSLNKAANIDQFKKWADSHGHSVLLLCEKLDGMSISTQWKDGSLIQAATRGNGDVGDEITVNAVKMKGVPKKLAKKFTGHIRGEVVLTKSDHKEYFSEYSNPRNAASGIAKRLDGEGVQHLTVMMYTVEGKDFKTEEEQFEFIDSLGVNVTPYTMCLSVQDVLDVYELYGTKKRAKLDYDIDGLVIRINDIAEQEALGEKNHRPAGQVAFKFEAEEAESILRAIVWQVGNSGRITPVGEFDEVEVAGAKLKRASLYNYNYIIELGLDVGCTILIRRNNDVIPRIESVVFNPTKTTAKKPDTCPECGTKTVMEGAYIRCPNKSGCPAQTLGRILSWINELNILDWSGKTVQKMIDAGLVADVADLYKVTPSQLSDLDRMGPKLAQKLVDIMDGHREITLAHFIGGLGIDGVATSTSQSVINAGYTSVDDFLSMSIEDFEAIPKFGRIRAEAFYYGLQKNKQRIKDILDAGVKIKAKASGNLNSKSFCFTGSSKLPRAELHKLVEDNGGLVKKKVDKDLKFLVVANPDLKTSKITAAKKLGTTVISEDEFMNML